MLTYYYYYNKRWYGFHTDVYKNISALSPLIFDTVDLITYVNA